MRLKKILTNLKKYHQNLTITKIASQVLIAFTGEMNPRDSSAPNHVDYYKGYDQAVSDITSFINHFLIKP